jgi:hypothetical protein
VGLRPTAEEQLAAELRGGGLLPLPAIHTDILITRRKLFQIVTSPEGWTLFTARQLGPCIQYLREGGISEYLIICGPDRHGRQLVLHIDEKDQEQWQNLSAR